MAEDTARIPSELEYDLAIRRRLRVANAAAWFRATGIQVVWLVVLVAGAGVPLTQAVASDGWTWVSPVLGFIVVLGAGIERIFSKTTEAAVSLDVLRRSLAGERRQLMSGVGEYAESEDAHRLYAERVEALIAEYDAKMVDYNTRMLGQAQ
jgi:hypothetical protein